VDAQSEHVTLREFEAAAGCSERDFVRGSGDEWTLRRNCEAFSEWRFRLEHLPAPPARHVRHVWGTSYTPVLIAPFG
jgi:hypothetical protein